MTEATQSRLESGGRFAMAVVDGRARNGLSWRRGRIVLTDDRLLVSDADRRYAIEYDDITGIGGRADVNQAVASVADYVAVHRDDDVLLLEAADITDLEYELYDALLDGESVTVAHPLVEGGVVQSPPWIDGRTAIGRDEVAFALNTGSLVTVTLDSVISVETRRREVDGRTTLAVDVTHTDDDRTVTTSVVDATRQLRLLASYLDSRSPATGASVELNPVEQAVVLALYSGVNQFRLPTFLDMEPEAVSDVYDRLIEAGVLEPVRVRREVSLTPRGRRLANGVAADR